VPTGRNGTDSIVASHGTNPDIPPPRQTTDPAPRPGTHGHPRPRPANATVRQPRSPRSAERASPAASGPDTRSSRSGQRGERAVLGHTGPRRWRDLLDLCAPPDPQLGLPPGPARSLRLARPIVQAAARDPPDLLLPPNARDVPPAPGGAPPTRGTRSSRSAEHAGRATGTRRSAAHARYPISRSAVRAGPTACGRAGTPPTRHILIAALRGTCARFAPW
jgi:hypothetical protein